MPEHPQHPDATALIAEDEPLLATALRTELARAWPELRVLATVGDGASAVTQALQLRPDVLFFDIQMPGMTGLEAAAELLDAWDSPSPAHHLGEQAKPFPALVFVTAYDQYAVAAFEAQAIDYLLKPVQTARLLKTVQQLKNKHAARAGVLHAKLAINKDIDKDINTDIGTGIGSNIDTDHIAQNLSKTHADVDPFEATLVQLRALLAASALHASSQLGGTRQAAPPLLHMLQASVSSKADGSALRMVPVADVLYFEAADKYIRVLTANAEYLIRTPLKELLPQLDAAVFWQIHRGTVVRASAIHTVLRDEQGKLGITLHGSLDKLAVSRLYGHLFKAM